MVFEAHGMSFPCTELLLFNYAKVLAFNNIYIYIYIYIYYSYYYNYYIIVAFVKLVTRWSQDKYSDFVYSNKYDFFCI